MELNLAVGDFLWSLPNLIHHVNTKNNTGILGNQFNSLNEFIFQIANVFSSKIFCLCGSYIAIHMYII